MKRFALIAPILIFSTPSFAFFCPNNFNQINVGDTITQVAEQCGKPTSEKSYKLLPPVPQEWTYYVAIPNDPAQMAEADVGSMKMTFAFVNNKVVNMTSNGVGTGSTDICNNIVLRIGSSIKDVEKACGKPAMVTQTNLSPSQGDETDATPPTEIAEWKYETPTGTVMLNFENGRLKERK